MSKILPAALTKEIAGSAAVQIAEYNHAEKMKKRKECFNVAACVPVSIVKEIAWNIPAGAGVNENN